MAKNSFEQSGAPEIDNLLRPLYLTRMKETLKTAALILLCLCSLNAFADNQTLMNQIVDEAKSSGSDSLFLIQNGQVLFQSYFDGNGARHNIQSVTKSVASLDIMILLDQGLIQSLDQPMSTWIPQWKSDPQKSLITLKMIMNHTSGLPDTDTVTDFFKSPDYIQTGASVALIGTPGAQFKYSTIGVSLLQPVISLASGKTVEEFTQLNVFNKLDINDSFWDKDKAGHEETGGGLSLSPDDLVKLGQMMLNNGAYNGATVINPSDEKTLTTKSESYFNYGLLWWLDLPVLNSPDRFDVFSAYGWGGQYITVYPEKQLIAVRTKDPASIDSDQDSFNRESFFDFRTLISQWQ